MEAVICTECHVLIVGDQARDYEIEGNIVCAPCYDEYSPLYEDQE